ncbi:MAG: hypothetical protein EBZ40_12210 [Gammaproteobacteria bacterium]|nr:hypothetical protein [Gammaproteobacteria bacterium]
MSDVVNRVPQNIGRQTLDGIKFRLHDPRGLGRSTRYNLRGKMFDVHVYGSDGTKYAAVDTAQQDPRWPMGVEITEAEMLAVAKLFGAAAEAGNLVTWYPVVQAITGRPIHKVLVAGDVTIRIVPKLNVRIARNFPLTNVMIDVRAGNAARFAVAETDAPRHVVPVIAEMFGVSSSELMSLVHFPGVVSAKGVIKRGGKHTEDAGLMLNRWTRSFTPRHIDSCGACGERLVNAAKVARTDPNASVQVAVCGSCAKSDRNETNEIAIAGHVFRTTANARRLVRCPDASGAAPVGGAALSEVGLAVLLSLQRLASTAALASVHPSASTTDSTTDSTASIVNPLARNIASLNQFSAIVGPMLVLRPFGRLALRINLRCALQKCYEAFDGEERLAFDAECEKLKVRKITGAELHAKLVSLLAATKAVKKMTMDPPPGPPGSQAA